MSPDFNRQIYDTRRVTSRDTISQDTMLYLSGCTILDINYYTNAKCGQKVLFSERAKSAYFRSASSDRDNKLFFLLGLGTRFLLALLSLYEKFIGL